MNTLEDIVRHTVQGIRDQMGNLNANAFSFTISASGRTMEGNALIEYRLRDTNYIADVTGSNVADVVAEYSRRRGWNMAQTPLMIAAPVTIDHDE